MFVLRNFTRLWFCDSCSRLGQLNISRLYSFSKLAFEGKLKFLNKQILNNSVKFYHIPRRCYSVHLYDFINDNEENIRNYLNKLTDLHRNNEDLEKKLSLSSFYSRNIHNITKLLSSRAVLCDELKSLEELKSDGSKDKDLLSLVENERSDYMKQLKLLDKELIMLMMPEEPHDVVDDLIIEIKHGIGGQEAMLFAKDLFEMYCRYIVHKGWRYEIADTSISEIGGLRTASLLVYGVDAFKYLRFEGGVHRVQRVPSTDKGGRIHTSTVGVAILPQPSEVEVVIKDSDLKIETKRASGAGGQHVNTTDSAVRIIHIPTGTTVECQEERSQLRNKTIGIQKLRAIIYETQINELAKNIKSKRKLQFGTSARSEKIRTYNFNQDRITDHRIGLSLYNMDSFLEGSELLDKMLLALREESDLERFTEFITTLKS
ncbi:mitochondrial translation release factor 1 [Lycorma delicatula]|uniref:mitochondrial translation release factor 1 n=1 Tax=Lycorma delicatula TaxID=130591 RepID=UPI003F50F773